MPYILHFPIGGSILDVTTSQDIVSQVWSELALLRHVRTPRTMSPLWEP